jgi:hypothetical protein
MIGLTDFGIRMFPSPSIKSTLEQSDNKDIKLAFFGLLKATRVAENHRVDWMSLLP